MRAKLAGFFFRNVTMPLGVGQRGEHHGEGPIGPPLSLPALLAAGMLAVAAFLASLNSPAASVRVAAGAGLSGYLDPFKNFGENGLIFLSFVLAWTISPIALQRIQAARSDGAARRGLTAAAASLTGLYALVVLIGIMSFPLYGGRTLTAPLVSTLISERRGPVLGGLLFAAVLAAVLSTLDTALNAGALALARDVWDQLRPPAAGNNGARRGRAATVVMATLVVTVNRLVWRRLYGLASTKFKLES